jgi:aminoglycoside/choline kinase family phosphotransferase
VNPGTQPRLALLNNWLRSLAAMRKLELDSLQPASSDASFRRYFRVMGAGRSFIVMDAPPDHEDCGPFLHVTRLLRQAGINVPAILAQDIPNGFLLISDL